MLSLFTLWYNRSYTEGRRTAMISTKGRYAVRVMIDLAKQEQGRNIPLREIADRQEISKKYLEIIMKEMAEAGLLIAASGRGGGYRGMIPRWGAG